MPGSIGRVSVLSGTVADWAIGASALVPTKRYRPRPDRGNASAAQAQACATHNSSAADVEPASSAAKTADLPHIPDIFNAPDPACLHHRRPPSTTATRSTQRPRARSATPSTRALDLLDRARRASPSARPTASWHVNQWLKKAVLLSFRLNDMDDHRRRPRQGRLVGQGAIEVRGLGRRRNSRRPASARCPARSCATRPLSRKNVVLMPSFVNLGGYVDEGTMVDTWATVGSCAADRQERASVGRRRHRRRARAAAGQPDHHRGQLLHRRALGSGRGRGGARRLGAVDGRVHLGASTKIVERDTGKICISAKCRPTPWWCPAPCRASRCRTARPAPRSPARSSSSASTRRRRAKTSRQRTAERLRKATV